MELSLNIKSFLTLWCRRPYKAVGSKWVNSVSGACSGLWSPANQNHLHVLEGGVLKETGTKTKYQTDVLQKWTVWENICVFWHFQDGVWHKSIKTSCSTMMTITNLDSYNCNKQKQQRIARSSDLPLLSVQHNVHWIFMSLVAVFPASTEACCDFFFHAVMWGYCTAACVWVQPRV